MEADEYQVANATTKEMLRMITVVMTKYRILMARDVELKMVLAFDCSKDPLPVCLPDHLPHNTAIRKKTPTNGLNANTAITVSRKKKIQRPAKILDL
jgi:hypothetical protein